MSKLLGALFLFLIAPIALAQQGALPGQPQFASTGLQPAASVPAPHVEAGWYVGDVFDWPTRYQIDVVDANGMLHGYLKAWDNPGAMRQWPPTVTHFNTHFGPGGLPETIFPNRNKYSEFRPCGQNLCVRFFHGAGGQTIGSNAADAWTDVVLTRCAQMPCLPPGITHE